MTSCRKTAVTTLLDNKSKNELILSKISGIDMKKKIEVVKETEEEKQARWAKQAKLARSFAKKAGVNMKKIAKERKSSLSSQFDY